MDYNINWKLMVLVAFSLLIFVPLGSASDIQVQKISSGEVLVKGLDKAVTFDLNFTNLGSTDNFELYNLVGFSMSPSKISLESGETKEISLELTPIGTVRDTGLYTINYYIKRNSDGSQSQEALTFKIADLGDVFEIGSNDIDLEKNSIEIFIRNKENINFDSVNAKFSSPFFEIEEDFSLDSRETKRFTIELNPDDFRNLVAGFYTMVADVSVADVSSRVEGVLRFVEKDISTTTRSEFGFIVNTQIIEKKNEGNVIQQTETTVQKNIISRLFTSFDPEPDIVEREGAVIYYTWTREIGPGQTLPIHVKTNWLFPFLIIFFLILIVILTNKYAEKDVVLRKRVSFVRAKGGEFALKVSIFVNAKKHVERVNVVDRLPPLVEIHERFGGETPSRIDKKNRRVEWNFENLDSGERRVLSYIIYSKVGVVGRFALPSAMAIYEKDGEIHESESNRAFFVAEQRGKEEVGEE